MQHTSSDTEDRERVGQRSKEKGVPRYRLGTLCGEEIDDEIEMEIERKRKKTVNGGLHLVRTMDWSTDDR